MIAVTSKHLRVVLRPQRRVGVVKLHHCARHKYNNTEQGFQRSAPCCHSRMSSAEVARTITSLLSYGTLSTITEDGSPLGTFVTFVLEDDGCPLLRLRADAVHTSNLKQRPQCTLFIHAAESPARQLARVTLLGSVEPLSEDEAVSASARHSELYRDALGVDAPHPDDTFMRLQVEQCFFVSGLGVCTSSCVPSPSGSLQKCRLILSVVEMLSSYGAYSEISLCADS